MIIDLQATSFEVVKKGDIKRMRKEGKIPAVIYGHKEKSKRIYVLLQEFKKVLEIIRKEAVTINLLVSGKKLFCVIKSIQHDPTTGELLHIDFQHIHKKEKIRASIPIHLLGVAPGIKKGGIQDQHLYDVVVKCLPGDLPSHIDVDISSLDLGQTIHLADIDLPQVDFELPKESTIVSMLIPRAVVAEVKPEEAVAEGEEEKEEEAPAEEGKEKEKAKPEQQEAKKSDKAQ
jgi:large subunit ribosomal protein L25